MSQSQLHIVYGGELIDPAAMDFKSLDEVETIGIFSSYEDALDAWKAQAQRTVDNAHMRYFVAPLSPLTNDGGKS